LIYFYFVGNGKSLVIQNLTTNLPKKLVTQIHSSKLEYPEIIQRLLAKKEANKEATAFHFDFACPAATKGKDDFIFALTIMRGFSDPVSGALWLCRKEDYYLIELNLPHQVASSEDMTSDRKPILLTDILPKITCLSPRQALKRLTVETDFRNLVRDDNEVGRWFMGFDEPLYQKSRYQRPYKHLSMVSR
jgi:hypothetical protein